MTAIFKTRVVIMTAVVAAACALGSAFSVSGVATGNTASAAMQTVTITAARMTSDQKLAYDAAESGIQTVVISARKLTSEQKLAMDQEQEFAQKSVADAAARQSAI
ncbi:hypothetical protein [Undibacterium oligocarboniphilum]|uniref:Lipoprotein n=1 Tax=Undibacterium oligocarboniphilum TaxID=666702 RepID=A0A850QLU2_9BURK|nr:hypothetical protein [Undibacterium oligocarboniphilum]MBC3869311.1 hypothetical protein [Undibacterium oligocarboniphilum]NVO77690.1 hypothetical protein [Undibacterium oligocarboniphilum]